MGGNQQRDVTELLHAAGRGEVGATDELLPQVYRELRSLAGQRLAHERPGLTLQPTALVHEAYLRLVRDQDMRWESRAHFFVAAATAMRRILVERARRAGRIKHGGGRRRIALQDAEIAADETAEDLVTLDAALTRLAGRDPRKAQVVVLRYFGGLSIDDAAQALGVSPGTVKNDWNFAKAWLYREMKHYE